MSKMTPPFPPLLKSHELPLGQNPTKTAVSGAVKGHYSAGDLLWLRDSDTLNCAIILEPEVDRQKALNMIFVLMVALGDAIGAIAPPELAITHYWPNKVLANGAEIGTVNAILSENDDADGCPLFMALATHIKVRPTSDNMDPGLTQSRTTLWDEGCGALDAMQLLEATARHFMRWVHTWEEEGLQPVLAQLSGRMTEGHPISLGPIKGTYLGLDENANLLLKHEDETKLFHLSHALDTTPKAAIE